MNKLQEFGVRWRQHLLSVKSEHSRYLCSGLCMYIIRWSYTLITSGTKKVKRKRYNSYRSKAVPSCRWKTVYCFSVLYVTFFFSPIKEYDHSGEESMSWKVSNIDWSFNKVIVKSRCINFDYHFVYRNVSHAPRPVTIIFSSFLTRRVTLPNQLLFQGSDCTCSVLVLIFLLYPFVVWTGDKIELDLWSLLRQAFA